MSKSQIRFSLGWQMRRQSVVLRALFFSTLVALLAGWFVWSSHRSVAAQQSLPPLNINTVAGSAGASGLIAQFNNARGIVAASNTVYYVADTGNHVVRKVDTSANTVTVFAGQIGVQASSSTATNGDGGLATAAQLNQPSDVALDGAGNVYIADTGNRRIRKVTTAGVISTVAGNGAEGSDLIVNGASFREPRGMVFSSANNNSLIIADAGNHRIVSLNSLLQSPTLTLIAGNALGSSGTGEDGDPATNTFFNTPTDVAVLGTNIYVTDTNNHRVRVIQTGLANPIVSHFAGTGSQGFSVDSGQATTILLNSPAGVSVDNAGNVYISDTGNHRIRVVTSAGSLTTIAGRSSQGYNGDGSPATNFKLNTPLGAQVITVSNVAQLLFMDTGNGRLRKIANGALSTIVSDGSGGFAGDDGLAASAKLDGPSSVAVDSQNNWYIADTNNQVIRKVNASDGKISTYAGTAGMASASATGTNGDGAAANLATLNAPSAVVVDAQGNLFIADTGNRRIRRVDATTKQITTVTGQVGASLLGASALNQPTGLAIDTSNVLYIADAGNHVVIAQRGDGSMLFKAGQTGLSGISAEGALAPSALFKRPTSVAVNGTSVYVADTDNHRIRRIQANTNGDYIVTSYAPSGGVVREGFEGDGSNAGIGTKFRSPTGIASDPAGNLYVVDSGNNRVRRIGAGGGLVSTVVGNGTVGFSGDGGLATLASLSSPSGLFATSTSIYIADTGNNRVRRTSEQPNTAPVLASLGNKTVSEGSTLAFTLLATDQAGQTLTYSISASTPTLPSNATLNATTGEFNWTPGFDVATTQAVNFSVTFTVTDSGSPALSDSETLTITVNPTNRPPVADSGTVPATVEATGPNGAAVPLVGTASDPDGDNITSVVWSDTRPGQSAVTIGTALSISPTLALGQHSIILTATSGTGNSVASTSTAAKTLIVQDTTPPTFSSTPANINETITTGNSKVVNFTLPTATDLVSGARTVTANPASGSTFPLGTTTVTLSTSDAANNTRTATFTVTVTCNGSGCSGGGGGGSTNSATFNMAAYAGNGNYGNGGDAGQATAASFRRPRGLALDAGGNLYVSDSLSHQIRRITSAGVISLYAGAGKGFSGDNAAATGARLNNPTGLAVDATRNLLFIADTNNHRIRRVDLATGTITTFAGTGLAGVGADGAATTTPLNAPEGVAVDGAGNVYIADTGNNRVVRVANNTLTVLSGNGTVGFAGDGAALSLGRFNHPTGISVSSDGATIYVADRGNNRIRRISNNTLATVAGTGTNASSGDGSVATAAGVSAPTDVLVDALGNLFITESDSERIRRVGVSDNKISTIAGNGNSGWSGDDGPGVNATVNTPTGLARNATNGVVFFCDAANLRVRRLLPTGPANNLPVPDSLANVLLNKSQSVNLALSATDADGDSVTFALVPALSFVSVTNANPAARTATLFINPNNGNVGVYTVRVQATDSKGGTGQTAEFTITINDPNAPPNRAPIAVMNSLSSTLFAPSGTTAATVNLDGSGSSDPDGDPLTYEWYDNNQKIAMGVTATVQLTIGAHSIRLEVVDNKNARGASANQNVTVQGVTQGNRNPVAVAKRTPTDNEIVAPNGVETTVTFDGTMSTDPDGDTLSYEWYRGTTTTPFATTAIAAVTLPVGEHAIRLRVTDGRGGENTSADMTFMIVAPPPEITVTSVSPSSGKRGTIVNIVINGTGFTPDCYVTVNSGGVTVTTTYVSSTRLTASLNISGNTMTSARTITVTRPNGASGSLLRAFSILP